jgi:hypothetical protein
LFDSEIVSINKTRKIGIVSSGKARIDSFFDPSAFSTDCSVRVILSIRRDRSDQPSITFTATFSGVWVTSNINELSMSTINPDILMRYLGKWFDSASEIIWAL